MEPLPEVVGAKEPSSPVPQVPVEAHVVRRSRSYAFGTRTEVGHTCFLLAVRYGPSHHFPSRRKLLSLSPSPRLQLLHPTPHRLHRGAHHPNPHYSSSSHYTPAEDGTAAGEERGLWTTLAGSLFWGGGPATTLVTEVAGILLRIAGHSSPRLLRVTVVVKEVDVTKG